MSLYQEDLVDYWYKQTAGKGSCMVNNYPRFEVKDSYNITLKVKVPGS